MIDRTDPLPTPPGSPAVLPVVLSGGVGTRLWPASRRSRPKQLLPLVSDRSMIVATIERTRAIPGTTTAIVVTNQAHAPAIRSTLQMSDDQPPTFILEPTGRNTAPAVAAAALVACRDGDDPLLLVLPSDHTIDDEAAFAAAVQAGATAAADGALVTFGIDPTGPETGYGYIRSGPSISGDVLAAIEFREKPDHETARQFVASGEYLWNSGMFLFRASAYLAELATFRPDMLDLVRTAVGEAQHTDDGLDLDADAFSAITSESIDYAVMENTAKAAVVPCDPGWSDVGSWASLWEIGDRDDDDNILTGDVIATDVTGSLIRSDSRLVAVVGIEDVVVIETADAVLVTSRTNSQRVKDIVDELERRGRPETDVPKEES
ncbi:MAG: mannose-1-phosphate guanylyltransferase/mannose-6-phosphate isomerase [Acidimicrobiia bacterium]|nr:mannose-1-phosphate guanylyltransferase/mannose-6-phosphate isomerase [Acidimicrobiia bacterium]